MWSLLLRYYWSRNIIFLLFLFFNTWGVRSWSASILILCEIVDNNWHENCVHWRGLLWDHHDHQIYLRHVAGNKLYVLKNVAAEEQSYEIIGNEREYLQESKENEQSLGSTHVDSDVMWHTTQEENAHLVEMNNHKYLYDPGYWRHTNHNGFVNFLELLFVVIFDKHHYKDTNICHKNRKY